MCSWNVLSLIHSANFSVGRARNSEIFNFNKNTQLKTRKRNHHQLILTNLFIVIIDYLEYFQLDAWIDCDVEWLWHEPFYTKIVYIRWPKWIPAMHNCECSTKSIVIIICKLNHVRFFELISKTRSTLEIFWLKIQCFNHHAELLKFRFYC